MNMNVKVRQFLNGIYFDSSKEAYTILNILKDIAKRQGHVTVKDCCNLVYRYDYPDNFDPENSGWTFETICDAYPAFEWGNAKYYIDFPDFDWCSVIQDSSVMYADNEKYKFRNSFPWCYVRTLGNGIKKIIINPPATIILWNDGTKTISKVEDPDVSAPFLYDPEVGVAMCIAKKFFGSRHQFQKAVKEASDIFIERANDEICKSFKANNVEEKIKDATTIKVEDSNSTVYSGSDNDDWSGDEIWRQTE